MRALEYQLKNQQRVIIRKAEPEDAKEMVSVMKTAFDETRFLSRNADEFQTTPEQERVFIENVAADPNQELYVALYEDQVIGICSVGRVRTHQRYRHRAETAFMILKKYCGLGIGGKMMQECIAWCREHQISQLELSVIKDNQHAIQMYQDFGFTIVGCMPHAFHYEDGTYADEYDMVLPL